MTNTKVIAPMTIKAVCNLRFFEVLPLSLAAGGEGAG
jgi:hypothetical protein